MCSWSFLCPLFALSLPPARASGNVGCWAIANARVSPASSTRGTSGTGRTSKPGSPQLPVSTTNSVPVSARTVPLVPEKTAEEVAAEATRRAMERRAAAEARFAEREQRDKRARLEVAEEQLHVREAALEHAEQAAWSSVPNTPNPEPRTPNHRARDHESLDALKARASKGRHHWRRGRLS